MNKDKILSLLYKKLKNGISEKEQSMLDVWSNQTVENEQLLKETAADWQLVESYEAQIDIDIEGDFKLLQQRIQKEESSQSIAPIQRDKLRIAHQPIGKMASKSLAKSRRNWIGWAAAAVVALAISFWFLTNDNAVTSPILALETQSGQQKEIQLADGTKVWLNGNSQLEYPIAFEGENRLVKLIGEAFFEVAKNAEHPFIIRTDKAKVTVLGTSFNVRARSKDLETAVLVKTGKVRLENITGDKKVELIANQKGIYNSSNNTIKETVAMNGNELAWHNNILVFSNTPLVAVIADLAHQFEVEIEVMNTAMNACKWDGRFSTKNGAKSILQAIASDFKMELKVVDNGNYELIGGKCQ